jgi:hypothetical protein
MLPLENFTEVMGPNILLWPLPVHHMTMGGGFYYPKVPDVDAQTVQ